MDVFAHALWASVGIAAISRARPIETRTVVATVGLAALPDLAHPLPLIGWWLFGEGSASTLWAYALALPCQEPAMPPMVAMLAHHVHCTLHSAIVAGSVTMLLWKILGRFWIPLLGWWSHVVIDVFTHSAEYYASPVFYPITQRGFDGLAWNTPWFMVVNYLSLGLCALWLIQHTRHSTTRENDHR
jgi:hypothetical protein